MKKFILAVILSVFLFFTSGVLAADTLDCNESLIDATKGRELVNDWGKTGESGAQYTVDNSRKNIEKTNGSSCVLMRTWEAFGSIVSIQEVKMSYFANADDAMSGLSQLRGSEPGIFRVKSSGDTFYSGYIYKEGVYKQVLDNGVMGYEVDGPLYGRTVSVVGNCLIQAKDQLNSKYVYKNSKEYEDTWGEPPRQISENFADGLSRDKAVQAFCGSGKGGGFFGFFQKPQTPKSNQSDEVQPAAQKSRPDSKGYTPVFIQEWFKLVAAGIGVKMIDFEEKHSVPELSEKEKAEVQEIKDKSKISKEKLTESLALINQFRKEYEAIKNAKYFADPYGIEYREPGSSEFKPLTKGYGMSNGGAVRTNRLTYIQTPNAVIELQPIEWSAPTAEVEFIDDNPVLKSGMMRIKDIKGEDGKWLEVKTPIAQIKPVGTEFAVAHDGKQNKDYIIVYEGQVEVRPLSGGKSTIVSATDDEPGIMVIIAKFSTAKFVTTGIVLALVIGSIVFLLKRKSKTSRKRR